MKVGKAIVRNFGRGNARAVRATIRNGRDVFVNFNGEWEWYRTGEPGYEPGMEKFLGYVRDPRHLEVLDRVFLVPSNENTNADPEARYHPPPKALQREWIERERDTRIGAYFAPKGDRS